VDWNPLQRASSSPAPEPAAADRRALRELCEQLEGVHGDMDTVVRKLGFEINEITSSGTGEIVSDKDKPVDLKVWVTAFGRITDIPVEEVESTFRVLDPDGAGLVPASRLQEVGALATASDAEEESSPTRRAWRLRSSQTRLPHWKAYHSGGLGLQPLTAPGDALRANPHLRAINLWGNRLCNRGAAALAAALEANFGLQYLGLGRNLITHEGLERLCQSVGYIQVDSDKQAANVQKAIKDSQKSGDKKGKTVVKKDGRGRDRYTPEPRCDSLEELKDSAVAPQVARAWSVVVGQRVKAFVRGDRCIIC
ncbi:unnamed protein product, partial [Prorocentrum cordatum]